MPLGTQATSVRNMPTEPFVVDDALWKATAKKNVQPVNTEASNPGVAIPFTLPQAGIVSGLLVEFDGQIVVSTGAVTTTDRWPYGFLSVFTLAVNGQQDLHGAFGEDYRVLEDIAYPAYTESVDVFPGTIGGGNSVATGTYPISLSWLIPVATEPVTLTGALYAQSPSTSIQGSLLQATLAQLFSIPANVALTGTWTITETMFVPAYDSQGRIIVPSGIGFLHSVNSVDLPLTSVGATPNRIPLVRGSGNLQRLLMAFRSTPTQRLSAFPNASAATSISALSLSYGATQTPYNWNPASVLERQNNLDYGFPPPFDYLLLDTLKQDPARDAIVFAGLTELAVFAQLNSAVALSGGTAHMVEETVFQ